LGRTTANPQRPFTRLLHHRFGDEVFLDGVEPLTQDFGAFDNFAAEFREISRSILEGDQPLYGIADARANATAILALFKAAEAGKAVTVR
jgi:D-xylose 1-dehydrogenase (NADP+, D-xylono-1,5-lactone-forming)